MSQSGTNVVGSDWDSETLCHLLPDTQDKKSYLVSVAGMNPRTKDLILKDFYETHLIKLHHDDVMRAAILNWSPVPSVESGQTPVAGRPGAAPAQLQAVTCGGAVSCPP